jgi:cytoskeletal protein RodZ
MVAKKTKLNIAMFDFSEYYARLTVTSSVTVALNPSALKLPQQHALGTWTIVLIVVLVISALILGAAVVFLRPWKHTTNRNKASSWRASRDRSSSNQAESNPIPVQNGDVGAPTSAIVPSGTRYTDSIDMHTPLRMVIRQTSV